MIIQGLYYMPYAYTVEALVKLPRSLGRRKFVRTGTVERMVTEVSPSDAPVVATLQYDTSDSRHEIRYFDGAFYVHALSTSGPYPASGDYGIMSSSHLLSSRRKKVCDGDIFARMQVGKTLIRMTSAEWDALENRAEQGFHIEAVMEDKIAEIVGSNERTARASAQAVLDDFLIIKQDVWSRIEEPCLIFRTPNSDSAFTAVCYGYGSKQMADDFVRSPLQTMFFALDDRQSLHDAIGEYGHDLLGNGIGDHMPRVIDIHDPSVFTKDWQAEEYGRVLSFAVSAYADCLGLQAADFVSAWIAAREAVAGFDDGKGNRDDLRQAMMSCLSMLVEEYSGEPTQDTVEVKTLLSKYGPRLHAARSQGMTP